MTNNCINIVVSNDNIMNDIDNNYVDDMLEIHYHNSNSSIQQDLTENMSSFNYVVTSENNFKVDLTVKK